ncbi:putative spermidine/putrescine transport system substrate-binding protein [Psychroflexus halocasei]|uniref:Putative spermidine/putrescine transport system substrate-binding protein n=2 Tax=Psychroflexus halocasei TaxID=908615 RepID=A0A1H4CYA3_9FLAO|nr:putative spermidine/putrescine transport system substrate-binding protein [Psychroflexus halocasei]
MKFLKLAFSILILFFLMSCQESKKQEKIDLSELSWDEIIEQGKSQEINMMMWKGDPKINAYMQDVVKPLVKEKYNVKLNIISGQGNVLVQSLMNEIQANVSQSELDMLWINGETFYQLRQIDALFGPWTEKLPNAKYIDFENPFIGKDFQQEINGYEMPWGNVQMTLIYNSDKVQNLPQSREELFDFVKENPGKLTFDNHFTGLTFMKSLLIDIAGRKTLSGEFDEEKYMKYSAELFSYLKKIKPYLWRKGKVFPEDVAQIHQLFAAGELWFTMSNNDAEVDNKISEGLFSKNSRAYVPEFGSIQNSHYLGIPEKSAYKLSAMLVINEMISPELQFQKMRPEVWGDGSVLDFKKLPIEIQKKWNSSKKRQYAPSRVEIQKNALQELAPEYMIRLADDFQEKILQE